METPGIEPNANIAALCQQFVAQRQHHGALATAPRPVDAQRGWRTRVLIVYEGYERLHHVAQLLMLLAIGG